MPCYYPGMLDEHYPVQRKMMSSSSQPYLQPIIRGKQGKTVEFGQALQLDVRTLRLEAK